MNNPSGSLQIYLFCDNQRKQYQTCIPTDRLNSAVLMRQYLHIADSSYLPWNKAQTLSVSLISFFINALLGRQAQWATSETLPHPILKISLILKILKVSSIWYQIDNLQYWIMSFDIKDDKKLWYWRIFNIEDKTFYIWFRYWSNSISKWSDIESL